MKGSDGRCLAAGNFLESPSWEKKKKKRISSVRGDRCRRIKSIVDDDKERKKQK